jgi:uncharacterized repeat protein (TIGR03803 family)
MMKASRLLPSIFRKFSSTALVTISCLLPVLAVIPAQCQTYRVIHAFTGGGDGRGGFAGVTLNGGILYGTAGAGGGRDGRNCNPRTVGCGVVFQMKQHNDEWVLTPLYRFMGFHDGRGPLAPVVFGPGGLLFGSTSSGGNIGVPECEFGGCGVVFTLHPSATACHSAICDWIENPIYQFASFSDGWNPMGDLAFDQAGNVYGTTEFGGNCIFSNGCGTVFQLTRSGSNWTKTTLHEFTHDVGGDGVLPYSGVMVDHLGNLFGTAQGGGANDYGTVFELTPSGSGWTYSIIYSFQNLDDGNFPRGGLITDAQGNLYGTANGGGAGGGGTIFKLSHSGGGWTLSVLASLPGLNGDGPEGDLAFDSAGNLYGTTNGGGAFGWGTVFKLTHSGGQWIYSDLYDFTCGADGGRPVAGPTLDSEGNLYGTANCGSNDGVVWQITP